MYLGETHTGAQWISTVSAMSHEPVLRSVHVLEELPGAATYL